jgi:hypothetical protein
MPPVAFHVTILAVLAVGLVVGARRTIYLTTRKA